MSFVTNKETREIYQPLLDAQTARAAQAGDSCVLNKSAGSPDTNPTVTLRHNPIKNRLEIVKSYRLTDIEQAAYACNELHIMQHLQDENADACCVKLYGWQLLRSDDTPLADWEAEFLLKNTRNSKSNETAFEKMLGEVARIELVMEAGVPLLDFMDEAEQKGIRLEETPEKIKALFESLKKLHHTNVMHQDIKPSNIVLVNRNKELVPVFIDFDTASECNDHHIPYLPSCGSTPYYKSPEQAGENGHDHDSEDADGNPLLTSKTDVYSLAVLVCELMGDALPKDREQRSRRRREFSEGDTVRRALAGALHTSPQERSTAVKVLEDLMHEPAAVPLQNVQSAPPVDAARTESSVSANQMLRIIGILVLTAVVLVGAIWLVNRNGGSAPAQEQNSAADVSSEGTAAGSMETEPPVPAETGTATPAGDAQAVTTTAVNADVDINAMSGDGVNNIEISGGSGNDIDINVTKNEVGPITNNQTQNNITNNQTQNNTSNITNYIVTEVQTTIAAATTVETTTTTAGIGVENGFAFSLDNGRAIVTGYTGTETVVYIPNTIAGMPVTAIGAEAFYGGTMERVEVPEGVERIESKAFAECDSLTSVRLPLSLKFIGYRAIHNRAVTAHTIDYPGNSTQWYDVIQEEDALGEFEMNFKCDMVFQ